ncbi:hypothetical protein [Streptomyces alkaliterrae]|uniref:Uncharacterized protein n=1 Tax=Streptomyces alkaliterrae TaxID=2213162 RepID=A0A7W3ZVM8_9ACTN|nr:hypothetical protein [Streptomyces alkaliterrae]MBB1262002.1 hypothetical protein [Streptomyces alkaliterrae]
MLLTGQPDSRYLEPFRELARDPWLPGSVENYIRDVLGVSLERKEG